MAQRRLMLIAIKRVSMIINPTGGVEGAWGAQQMLEVYRYVLL